MHFDVVVGCWESWRSASSFDSHEIVSLPSRQSRERCKMQKINNATAGMLKCMLSNDSDDDKFVVGWSVLLKRNIQL